MKIECPPNPRDEEEDGLLSDFVQWRRPQGRGWLSYTLAFFLGLSLFVNMMALFLSQKQDVDTLCSRYTSQSARHYVVPKRLASNYGLDPGHIKYTEADGGGYPVILEFEHHLHCVNLLRQSLYWNYGYYTAQGHGPFKNSPDIVKKHVGHCVVILRQVIMCQPETGVFGQYWVKEIDGPFVDFHTQHKCKNFEELKNWVLQHQVSEKFSREAKVVPRPGDVILDETP